MFELLNFIRTVNDIETVKNILSKKPYCISFDEDEDYILFKYNQTESIFSNLIVQDCRGIIISKKWYRVVCYPFTKFFNYGETNGHNIDWKTAVVTEKIDGSIIKLWYDKKWNVSTNGVIDAGRCDLPLIHNNIRSFKDIFDSCFKMDYALLDKDKTYIFELVSPYNKVVISYPETALYYLGERNNVTGIEENNSEFMKKYFKIPKTYKLGSLYECITSADKLPFNEEGYVVRDSLYRRIKIKSPAYVAVHHLKNNGVINMRRIYELIELNESDEFLTYYPEYTEIFNSVKNKVNEMYKLSEFYKILSISLKSKCATKKDYAFEINKINNNFKDFCFKVYDNESIDFKDYFKKVAIDKKLTMIGVKDE